MTAAGDDFWWHLSLSGLVVSSPYTFTILFAVAGCDWHRTRFFFAKKEYTATPLYYYILHCLKPLGGPPSLNRITVLNRRVFRAARQKNIKQR